MPFPVPSFDFRGPSPDQTMRTNALLRGEEYRNALSGVELEEARRMQQERGAVTNALKAPGAVDPATGLPTPQSLGAVMQASPEAGIQLANALAVLEQKKEAEKLNHIRGKLYEAQIDDRQAGIVAEEATGLQGLYDDLVAKNTPKEEMTRRMNEAKNEAFGRLSKKGNFSEAQLELFRGPYNPEGNLMAIRATGEYKNYFNQRKAADDAKRSQQRVDQGERRLEQADLRAEQTDRRIADNERRTEGYLRNIGSLVGNRGEGGAGGGGGSDHPGGKGVTWLVDPDTNVKYATNKGGKAWRVNDEGQWIEVNPNDIPKKAAKVGNIGAAGARESVFTQRVIQAGNQASKDLANIVKLPLKSDRGAFGTFGSITTPSFLDATKVVLGNKLSTEEQQVYNTMTVGFQRTLGQIETAGLMVPGNLTHQMDAVIAKPGDTNLTKLHKIAQIRQIIESGMEVIDANPRISDSEKEVVRGVTERVRKAMPLTHEDLIAIKAAQERDPKLTIRDALKQMRGGQAKDAPEGKSSDAEGWISRATKANPGMTRSQVIEEGKRLGKIPKDYK